VQVAAGKAAGQSQQPGRIHHQCRHVTAGSGAALQGLQWRLHALRAAALVLDGLVQQRAQLHQHAFGIVMLGFQVFGEPCPYQRRIVRERQRAVRIDHGLLFHGILHGPADDRGLMQALRRERRLPFDGDITGHLQGIGGGIEIHQRQ
jgi:hypothetical protein